MPIELKIYDDEFADEVLKSVPPGITVTRRRMFFRGGEFSDAALVTLAFIRDQSLEITRDLFVAWILSHAIQDDRCHISHRGRNVEKTETVIRRILDDELEIGKND
jgi:hypothetical protein